MGKLLAVSFAQAGVTIVGEGSMYR